MANYFSIFLVVVTLASGLIWLLDHLFWAPKRKAAGVSDVGAASASVSDDVAEAPLPAVVDTAQQIFPVLAFVLVLRSFLYEPFQIPSGSMMPTLLVGDFILVEKFAYGLKDPVWRTKLVETGQPERGDIAVFKYPEQPNLDYIKRVIGLPGDRIVYRDKQVYLQPACEAENQQNCPKLEPLSLEFEKRGEYYQNLMPLERYTETIGDTQHQILRNPLPPIPSRHLYNGSREFVVPEGHYFVLGDNRDNSRDSRFWGFVPEANLVGQAVAIWISFEFDRPPSSWVPGWIPTGIRFERIGGIE
ncbi:Signal peptidase I [Saliniradius amylolyticus]|uniref:Signal peptidase I n=1 Tax=Saliniradius amylolyticus TaxID=2183582 RepID=A0A2S2E176_9ALTE|nr:signal peptidase I [Saliniradius amylolyticus]AWL11401.1 Signal peptidase I [Saliniradius amylolyticus]